MAATTQALQRRPPPHSVATHQKKRFIRIPQRAKFVQSESGSLILQPRRKRSIVVIDRLFAFLPHLRLLTLKLFAKVFAHEGDGCLPNLPFFWSRVAPRLRAEVLWTERKNFGEVFSRRSPDPVRDVKRRAQQNDVLWARQEMSWLP